MIKKLTAAIAGILMGLGALCASSPRLAVVITIDGLQNYEIESYENVLDKDGLLRIINSGIYSPNTNCTYMPTDATADYASMMTGSTPHYHGMVADSFYSLLDDKVVSCIEDARYEGIGTDRTVSPRLLQATTIADQIKLYNQQSKVYAIGLNAESAIMLGGHLADGAIWIDNESGDICTTTYYDKGMPRWAEKMNKGEKIKNMCSEEWQSNLPMTAYQFEPSGNYMKELTPTFMKFKEKETMAEKMEKFKQSPFVNTLIKNLAVDALKEELLGTDNNPDLMCVEFTLNNPFKVHMLCAENEDMIMRLDQEIKDLLKEIDHAVGLENAVIVLTSPHFNTYNMDVLENRKINHGKFHAHRSMALLNGYLMAIYGQGRWVTGYYDKNINLNKTLIEENKIRLNEIEDFVAQFMMEFSGVHTAIPAYQIQTATSLPNDMPSRLRNSHYKNRSGDVVFTLLPGWAEYDERKDKILLPTISQPLVPVAIWAEGMTAEPQEFMIEDICPTLCHMLKIPFPNACIGSPIIFK